MFSPGRSHRFRDQQQNTAASTALPRSAVANLVLCFLSTTMTKISYTGEAARRGHVSFANSRPAIVGDEPVSSNDLLCDAIVGDVGSRADDYLCDRR